MASTQPGPSVRVLLIHPLLINGGQGNLTRIPTVIGLLKPTLVMVHSPVSSAAESYSPCPCSGRKLAQAFGRQTEEHLAACGR